MIGVSMATGTKLLSDSWKESRRADLLNSLKHLKPLQHLSSDDIFAIVQTAAFRAFDIGDIICQQVHQRIIMLGTFC